jgi:hypothetical protein
MTLTSVRVRKALFCAIALTFSAWAQQSPAASEDPGSAALLGRWRSLATSRGGIGSMLEFRAGGVVDFSPGAVVELRYRIEGDQLVLPAATIGGPEQRETVTWLSDDRIRLRSAAAGDPGEEFARQGSRASAAEPIVGEWIGSRDMADHKVKVMYFFAPSGAGLLLIPFVTGSGSYSLDHDTIHLALPNRAPADMAIKVEGDVLTFTTSDAHETRFKRY